MDVNPFETTRLIVEIPQIVLHERDEPDAFTDLDSADALAGEDMTEVHFRPRKQIRPQPVTMTVCS